MQYCMVLPRHLLQGGAKYSNLTTVRVSGDRFERGKYREFLYGSRLAAALGVWPWTDAYRSSELGNVLVSTLSAGMVGISDKIGEEDPATILQAVRADGVIVKPDVPLLPIDADYINDAKEEQTALVCATHTTQDDHSSAASAQYVFAIQRSGADGWSIDAASLGLSGRVFAYDYFGGTGRAIDAGQQRLAGQLKKDAWAYWVLAPVGESGMALIGDTGKFVTRGKARIAAVQDDAKGLHTSVLLAAGESAVTLALYAPNGAAPRVDVTNGVCRRVDYEPADGIARIELAPAVEPQLAADRAGGDRVTRLEVSITHP
jgi:hypothetical protein